LKATARGPHWGTVKNEQSKKCRFHQGTGGVQGPHNAWEEKGKKVKKGKGKRRKMEARPQTADVCTPNQKSLPVDEKEKKKKKSRRDMTRHTGEAPYRKHVTPRKKWAGRGGKKGPDGGGA